MGDFLYACVQLVHNLGAAAVVGVPALACWLFRADRTGSEPSESFVRFATIHRRLAGWAMLAWSAQIISGAGFGATTYYLRHALPELTGVGFAALLIKVSCAIVCFMLAGLYWQTAERWPVYLRLAAWRTLLMLGLTALISAAFLRWYG